MDFTYIFNINDFPYVEFGEDIKRKVRLVLSPYTTGEDRLSIVHVTIPPRGISEGHIHEDCEEYIYFDRCGKVVIDEKESKVNENSIVFASRGRKHECINTSDTEDLHLLCIFMPPLRPYGKYFELIEKTGQYLEDEKKLENDIEWRAK